MKKKIWILIIIVVFLAVLFVPIPSGVYKDGGTREYTALTYKIVDWNRMVGEDMAKHITTYIGRAKHTHSTIH